MGFRITTWNVNGIRNPFSYEPWRSTRTFESMFDILEADIVVFQETKIQRKDLRDDMVLVPGWDCYFSLPRVKKGYSGVVIYTRNATCAPIRAEEGLTGALCPPNSSTPFRDLPEDQQIGGYPTIEQLSQLELDTETLDSEGRCVILEFPAFVLLGLYCPANRDENRGCFRQNFFDLMDARIRNLVAIGKRVFVTGDLNISRGVIDAAHAAENIRKGATTEDDFVSAPARRLFNHLLSDGKVLGERDEGREHPALFDICRAFHPGRKGMYTCWEQRINARPGNYGSRIDYVLCGLDMQDWFCDSNIQEGLMGSDHCPVYAVFKDTVPVGQVNTNIHDIMNPPGVFKHGERQQEYTPKFLLPISGRLIPEFDRRRNIKDMFTRKPRQTAQDAPSLQQTTPAPSVTEVEMITEGTDSPPTGLDASASTLPQQSSQPKGIVRKRSTKSENPTVKRSKSVNSQTATPTSGQSTLKGFFKPKSTPVTESIDQKPPDDTGTRSEKSIEDLPKGHPKPASRHGADGQAEKVVRDTPTPGTVATPGEETDFVDPIVSKEDWSRLFTKKPPPKCEGHQEQCISLKTKKPGANFGRSFWICPRPLGPSGNKEKGTAWRCPTFIWANDWDSSTM
ncbi:DNA-(apurinic or apyrimidinic site) lyase APN2 [Aspergillus lucknowensis]|uniref:DNA-(apurinic or apyrimidinic site) endonuclease 2 n=1 Tax=Aspergillus lucknowensis TaxID=176173 RepID=A0ABR4LN86_9EURO